MVNLSLDVVFATLLSVTFVCMLKETLDAAVPRSVPFTYKLTSSAAVFETTCASPNLASVDEVVVVVVDEVGACA